MNIQLVVEQNHVCELSGLERTVIVLDAERTGRICRGRLHGLTERNAHAHRAPDAVHQIGGGTGDRAVVQRGEIAAHGDSLSAERVFAVLETGRHHAVRNEDDTAVKQGKDRADDRRMNVHAVRDQLNRDVFAVKGRADDARSAMGERRHGVVQVRDLPRAAAECLEAGVDVENVTRFLYRSRTLGKTRLIGRALSKIEMFADGRVAAIRLTKDMFRETGTASPDAHGIVNYLNEIEGVFIGILAEEQDSGTKFSLRAANGANVAQLAQKFGGGGHVAAAGISINGEALDAAFDKVIAAAEAYAREL